MSDFNVEQVEQFFKEHRYNKLLGEVLGTSYLREDDVRALVAQLVPAGYVVVPRHQLDILVRHLKYNRSHLITVEAKEALRIVDAALSPLPASSGPEQTKCKNPLCEDGSVPGYTDIGGTMQCVPEDCPDCAKDRAAGTKVFAKPRTVPCDYLTLGKEYEVQNDVPGIGFHYVDDLGQLREGRWGISSIIGWERIERACHTPAPAAKEVNNER